MTITLEYFSLSNETGLFRKEEIHPTRRLARRHIPAGICKMLAAKRSDFYFTLEEDERKCLASIERIDQKVRKKDFRSK